MKMVLKLDTDRLCAFAYNGREALSKVKESTQQHGGSKCGFDLILMDCNMPFMDGYEATTRIREYLHGQGAPQPIISAVTGHTEKMFIKQAIDSGMN